MNNVVLAIFKRNFNGYLQNPTGYVFICVFVLLGSLAAFWPNEFFTANLANLDQLNKYFPLIMLIFVPAITMSIWAEERRQGTDELLLTIPATDFDVVMGKYLAAVAIYGVSLLFSLVCNFAVLASLGSPDVGLFLCTYLGYFLVGLAMLSIGMVASFLTNNITVGFVLGAVFNSLPVGLAYSDVIFPPTIAVETASFSIAEQMRDFTQGVVSLSSLAYFLLIVAAMLYLAMVLIGRRHWLGGRDGSNLGPHYGVRVVSLLVGAAGVLLIAQHLAARKDLTSEGLTTLSDATMKIVSELDRSKPIQIEAFVSPSTVVPKEYVPIRLDLLNRLREIKAQGGANVSLRIIETEPFTEASDRAEKTYGIGGYQVTSFVRNQPVQETIYMGVAIRSGLDKIVIPFVSRSTPIEYEIVRSIATLNGGKRKRLGLFVMDEQIWYEVRQSGLQEEFTPPAIIEELKKQYDVETLKVDQPVPDNIDVLLAIQPTLLQPEQLDHLTAAVRRGVPTLIFQDPLSEDFPRIAQFEQQQERQQRGALGFMQAAATQPLWDLLGVTVPMGQIVRHSHNPMKQRRFPEEYVFIDNSAVDQAAGASLFDESDPISRGTQQLVFRFCGSISKNDQVRMDFIPLVRTSTLSGSIDRSMLAFGGNTGAQKTGINYTLAARIRGAPLTPDPKATATPSATAAPSGTARPSATASTTALPAPSAAATPSGTPTATASGTAAAPAAAAAPAKPRAMDVVVITDLDLLGSVFFQLRSQRPSAENDLPNFDNIAFVLNAIDVLAGDERFVEARKRRAKHRTLETLDEVNQKAIDAMTSRAEEFDKRREEEVRLFRQNLDDEEKKIESDPKLKEIDKMARLALIKRRRSGQLQAKDEQLRLRFEKELKELQRSENDEIRRTQDFYKACAVFIPPVFPLLVGLAVFFNRRAAEQEGVSKSRLK